MKLKYDKLLSKFAFNCNLRHYTPEVSPDADMDTLTAAAVPVGMTDAWHANFLEMSNVGRCTLTPCLHG